MTKRRRCINGFKVYILQVLQKAQVLLLEMGAKSLLSGILFLPLHGRNFGITFGAGTIKRWKLH